MANNDEITVWMNGKKTTIERGKSKVISHDAITKDEHAATVDKDLYQNNDTLSLPEKKDRDEESNHMSMKERGRKWKPVIIAIISAACIGGIFGLIMLKVVGALDDYETGQPSSGGVGNINDEDNDLPANDSVNGSSYNFPELKAYVIQGGVFEEESSVDEWQGSFQDAAFSPITWQKDDNYYLFVGIADTEEQANAFVEDIKETYGLDVFAKEWKTNEAELSLEDEEAEWLDSVIGLWNDSVKRIDEKSGLPVDDWKKVENDLPEKKNDLGPFMKKLTQLVSDLDNPSDNEASSFLVQIWYAMENELVQ